MTVQPRTPLPWSVCTNAPNALWHEGTTIWSPSDGTRVADTCNLTVRAKGNADFIVLACNSHDLLIEALRLMIRCMDGPRIPQYMKEPVRFGRLALVAAQVQS